ncbi:hypothetical protein CTheo_6877 [Ceratobasidium theobromae]|uniref:F-box-like domain containing protein n=1 Tax=Ceratobasidium theobromae TaxID=1582974 RepID=A0A5N5QE05_9AGAM|nr:hypothetical protein CTheo_6877 [Ceratobasidium theobromae]
MLLDIKHQRLLSAFPHLYGATIDAHSDVHRGDNHRFAYRDVIATLPPSLKRLEIIHAHGPDIRVISTVKKYCPHLEELRLGRCTMFNRVPACDFWASFPHDHDAYISSSETNSYSDSLGQELAPLKNLRSLRMGLYLSPSNIVLGHKLYHRRGIAAPETIVWQTAIPLSELPRNPFTQDVHPHLEHATTEHLVSILHRPDSEPNTAFDCPWCMEATADISKAAETAANAILRQHVPSLSKIQWMGWLTPGHLGVNSYEFPRLLEKSMTNV